MPEIIPILNTGDSAKRVDIVIVAEGYTQAERDKFVVDANTFITTFLGADNARLNAPFSTYKGFFNATALFFASTQSGTDQPNSNVEVNTYFNASQHGSDGRLLYGDGYKVESEVQKALASNAHELVIVLVNTPLYGGAGGSIAWASAGNRLASELALHEIGHSFAGLQDEYVDSIVARDFPLTATAFRESPHVTDSLGRIPWQEWMGYADGELGVIGTYEGGYYRSSGVWRATQSSKMLYLDVPFNAPEKEAFALKYYESIGDYLSLTSSFPGLYTPVTPNNALFSYTWKYAGTVLSTSTQAKTFDAYAYGAANTGTGLSLTTIDNTGTIRKNLLSTQQVETINISDAVKQISTLNYVVSATDANQILRFADGNNLIEIQNVQTANKIYFDGGAGQDVLKFSESLSTVSKLYVDRLESGTYMLGLQQPATWAVRNIENVQFQDFSVNLNIHQNAKTISKSSLKSLEDLYVAFFNRIPDADGLNYWIDQLKAGRSLVSIGDSFYESALASPELTGYRSDMTSEKFVNTVYINVLGRLDGADSEGLAYWLSQLNSGKDTPGSLVYSILNIAHGFKGTATWGWVADLLDNKAAVADKFAVDWGLNYLSTETSVMKGMAIADLVTATDTQAAITLIGLSEGQIIFG
ncbi:M64 family metallopeptidase [Undibacterium sp. Ji22W]|uniref:M64 family metallopeptidase n=1 Tax=Undibacterium sp. Ji22W TaxID=3413038 RepID=UPI003BF067F0